MARIIIVEEEQALLRLFILAIKALCPPFTEILGVTNGQEALEVYEKNKPDLIISDYKMPVMDGSKLTRTLRSMGETIPIILTSGNPSISEQAYNAGATLFAEKSELIRQLPGIIDHYLPK